MGMALRAGHYRELFFLRFPGRSHETPDAHGIGSDGLLGKYVFAGIDSGFEMLRPVTGRGGKHYDIDIGIDEFLESIESHEMMLRIDLDSRLDGVHQILRAHLDRLAAALNGDACVARDVFRIVAQPVERGLQLVFENIGYRDQVDVLVPGQQIYDSLRPATAATHQPGLEAVFGRCTTCQSRRRRGGEKASTGETIRRLHMGASYNESAKRARSGV